MVTPRPPRPGADDAELIAWAEANPWAIVETAARRGWTLSTRSVLEGARPTGRLIVEATTPTNRDNPVGITERIEFGPDNPAPEWARGFLEAIKAFGAPDGRSVLARLAEVARPVDPERRPDPILTVPRGGGYAAPERERGRLFGGLAPAKPEPDILRLQFFEEEPKALIRRVPLLALTDASGTPVMAQGRGAPLDLRLAVEAFLSVPRDAQGRNSVRLALTVRELRDALFPRGWTRRATQSVRPDDWTRCRDALLRARDRMIPMPDGGVWFPLALRRLPSPTDGLDGEVLLDVAIPPGAGTGPAIDRPVLRLLGVDSGPRYRAFLAVEAANWIPGMTRVPTPKGAHSHGWSGDPARYPVFTQDDRRTLAFGLQDSRNRTRADVDGAFERLPGVEIIERRAFDPRTGARGWRIVPQAAAEAIRRRRGEGGNRRK